LRSRDAKLGVLRRIVRLLQNTLGSFFIVYGIVSIISKEKATKLLVQINKGYFVIKGKPVVRRGRKARSPKWIVRLLLENICVATVLYITKDD